MSLESMALSRRQMLQLSAAAAAAGATLGPWVPKARAEVGGHLDLIAWEGFSLEPELTAWREAHGVTQTSAIMSNQDDVTAKLAGSNPVKLDLAEYSNGYQEVYRDIGALTPLDISKIPNYNPDDIYPPFYEGEKWYWDGTNWALPWCWGLDTLVVNPELAGVEIKSLKDLLKPELKGKVTFVDNPLTTWPTIAKVTGYGDKFPKMTKAELDDCFEKLGPYRDQCRVFASSNGDVISLFASGEIAACFCVWAAVPLETAKQNVTTVAVIPEEGAAVWADAWFIPMTAENTDTAHAFINQALSPEVQASLCQTAVCSAVNKKAVPLMDEATRSLFDYENSDKAFASIAIPNQPPRVSDEFATYDDWLQKWADFRAGF
jgi:spermidine/putrescine-binding protein